MGTSMVSAIGGSSYVVGFYNWVQVEYCMCILIIVRMLKSLPFLLFPAGLSSDRSRVLQL